MNVFEFIHKAESICYKYDGRNNLPKITIEYTLKRYGSSAIGLSGTLQVFRPFTDELRRIQDSTMHFNGPSVSYYDFKGVDEFETVLEKLKGL